MLEAPTKSSIRKDINKTDFQITLEQMYKHTSTQDVYAPMFLSTCKQTKVQMHANTKLFLNVLEFRRNYDDLFLEQQSK